MEKQIEKDFVINCIVKSKRERMLYELFNPKKRLKAIGRFCHRTMEFIEERKVLYSGNRIFQDELLELIQKKNSDICYIISWDSDIDGEWMEAKDAFEKAIGYGMPSIIIFDDFVVIETEQEQGAATKFVLDRSI